MNLEGLTINFLGDSITEGHGTTGGYKELVPDGLHPSDMGHSIMAEVIGKTLQEI